MYDEEWYPDYFSVIKVIDKIFPPIQDVDYTKISSEELVNRFKSMIGETKLNVSPKIINNLCIMLNDRQSKLYGKRTSILGNLNSRKEHRFDQKNSSIQYCVSAMKVEVIKEVVLPFYNNSLFCNNLGFNTRLMGGINKIKIETAKEKITEYVSKILDLTIEDNDSTKYHNFYYICIDILLHFGINIFSEYSLGNSKFSATPSELNNIIKNAIDRKRNNFSSNNNENGNDSKRINFESDFFVEGLRDAKEDVVNYIYGLVLDGIKCTEENKENLISISKEDKDEDLNEKIEKLIEINKELLKEFKKMNTDIIEIKAELAKYNNETINGFSRR